MVRLSGCIFLLDDDELLKNITIFEIKSAIVDSEPIHNKNLLKSKIKYGDEVTDFHDKEMPKVGSIYTCLTVILIDFLRECKYIEKEK